MESLLRSAYMAWSWDLDRYRMMISYDFIGLWVVEGFKWLVIYWSHAEAWRKSCRAFESHILLGPLILFACSFRSGRMTRYDEIWRVWLRLGPSGNFSCWTIRPGRNDWASAGGVEAAKFSVKLIQELTKHRHTDISYSKGMKPLVVFGLRVAATTWNFDQLQLMVFVFKIPMETKERNMSLSFFVIVPRNCSQTNEIHGISRKKWAPLHHLPS